MLCVVAVAVASNGNVAWCYGAHKNNDPDAGFSFPDRRHSSYSEVYPGVRVPSRLISCPPSFPVLRSVSRSAPSVRRTNSPVS